MQSFFVRVPLQIAVESRMLVPVYAVGIKVTENRYPQVRITKGNGVRARSLAVSSHEAVSSKTAVTSLSDFLVMRNNEGISFRERLTEKNVTIHSRTLIFWCKQQVPV
jgi:hypothetical protein